MATIEEKKELVLELTKQVQDSTAIYLLNYEGITVDKDSAFRMNLNKKGVSYRVVKNTFLKRAFDASDISGLDNYLTGMTAVMFGGDEDPMLPAKEVVAFHKKNPDVLAVKGVNLSGDLFDGSQIGDLAKMPGRQELIAEVVSLALGPGSQLVALLKGPSGKLASQLKSLQEKLEEN